jgi:hypothetical protein
MPLLPTGTNSGCELYCEAQSLGLTNGASVASFTDQSGNGRDLTAATSRPTFQTAVINGKSVVRWNGSQNPLTNSASLNVRCGWIVAKYTGASFAVDFPGLLSSLAVYGILVGTATGGNLWFDINTFIPSSLGEHRTNGRIYPHDAAPAPLNAFKIIFFRLWKNPIIMDGVSLGQDRGFTARKWNGDVALLALYSKDFIEEEIRANTEVLATNFGLSLADVYKYQADVNGHDEQPDQAINFYDPPEGDRISEAISTSKRVIDLKFSAASEAEVKYMKSFHAAHYASATPFFYRDYRVTPPEDIEGYFDSHYELAGANYDWNYSFSFRER